MKISSIFLAAVAVLFIPVNAADDEHTGTKWNIDAVVVSNEGDNFSFTYGNIDPSISTSFMFGGIYDGDCWSTTATSYGTTGVVTEDSDLFPDLALERSPDGTAVIVSFKTDTTEIAKNPALYDESSLTGSMTKQDKKGTMKFCVRFSIFDLDVATSTAKVKNYQESVISLDVTPNTEQIMTTKHLYRVEAELCEDQDQPFTQGTMISICLTPDVFAIGAGIIIESIDEFIWTRSDDSNISQQAIMRANTPSNNGLTNLTDTSGDGTEVRLETVLFASFYETAGNVTGSGRATLAFAEGSEGGDDQPKMQTKFSINVGGISDSKKQKVGVVEPDL